MGCLEDAVEELCSSERRLASSIYALEQMERSERQKKQSGVKKLNLDKLNQVEWESNVQESVAKFKKLVLARAESIVQSLRNEVDDLAEIAETPVSPKPQDQTKLEKERESLLEKRMKTQAAIITERTALHQAKETLHTSNEALFQSEQQYNDVRRQKRRKSKGEQQTSEKDTLLNLQRRAEQLERQLTFLERSTPIPSHQNAFQAAEEEVRDAMGEISSIEKEELEKKETLESQIADGTLRLEYLLRSCSLEYNRANDAKVVKAWKHWQLATTKSQIEPEVRERLAQLGLVL